MSENSSRSRSTSQQIPHPTSTNFSESFESPATKRFKRHESTDSSLSRNVSEVEVDEEVGRLTPSKHDNTEAIDSEGKSDGDNLPASQTELESSLPLIDINKRAIQEYEAGRAIEKASLELLGERTSIGRSVNRKTSIYVDAFNLALDTVLKEEGHLFDGAEAAVFEHWRNLSYEGQYLYVRLFLRKTAAWHRINRLHYYSDIADVCVIVKELLANLVLPDPNKERGRHAEEVDILSLRKSFSFVDGSETCINTLEEASALLMLDELKTIAKDAKLQGKNKKELLQSFHRHSQKQSGIGWRSLKRTDTEESNHSQASAASDGNEESDFSRDTHFVRRILSSTGECVRLSFAPRKLFERVHLVFYRSTEWTEKSLLTIILAKMSRRNFPEYIVCRSTNIFSTRDVLLEFETAVRAQLRVDDLIEGGGPVIENLLQVQGICENIYPRWKALVREEQRKEDQIYESGEGAYLRRFSPAWIYTRIIHKGLAPLARFKEHRKEHELLTELLDQRLFHAARRGSWYQRKALLEEHYMWALVPSTRIDEDFNKRQWKKTALKTCEEGLQDRECHLIFHHDLQKRITKLERSLRVAKRLQHDFGHVALAKAVERFVEGIRIEKGPLAAKGDRRSSEVNLTRRGAKTVWLDEREGGGECSVEAMCLSWYRDQGWKGFHSEGRIVRTLVGDEFLQGVSIADLNEFGYLFFDILFTFIPNVFQTPYQTCPLDLHTDAFYPSRISLINRRLVEISNGDAARILREIHERESGKQTCVVGLDWSYNYDDLQEIISCFSGEALATICKVMAQEYQQRGGGIPDLFLWHPDRKEVMFAEVKSENDRLSDTQRLWIHVLTGAGIKVEKCNAIAKEVKLGVVS